MLPMHFLHPSIHNIYRVFRGQRNSLVRVILKSLHSAQSQLCYEMFRDVENGNSICDDPSQKLIECTVFLLCLKELHKMSSLRQYDVSLGSQSFPLRHISPFYSYIYIYILEKQNTHP
uniref:Uncharacterized protein n=1 Tax=Sphaerodactylus townsendi TaxID=933632 RepID=A0ACB8F899_9SAUR